MLFGSILSHQTQKKKSKFSQWPGEGYTVWPLLLWDAFHCPPCVLSSSHTSLLNSAKHTDMYPFISGLRKLAVAPHRLLLHLLQVSGQMSFAKETFCPSCLSEQRTLPCLTSISSLLPCFLSTEPPTIGQTIYCLNWFLYLH